MTPWMIVVAALILRVACRSSGDRLERHAEYLAHKRSLRRFRARLPAVPEALSPVEAKLERLKDAPKKDREALLREFVEAKKKLEEAQKDLVADATGDAGIEGLKVRTEVSVEYKLRKKGEPPPGKGTAQGGSTPA
ncbi:MAG: hypothetical protein HYS14_01135 [Candidatus Rokubacteria bacterium]|nr:hypothetical protein [Candidatus Rokubacteria bacterium]